jgi:pimeloyl-ACP methyl ester carboxylesterase
MAQPTEQILSLWDGKIKTLVMKAGKGPALIYLHGDYGLFWNEFLDRLAENFTVYAPAHPGTTPGDPDGLRALDDMWDLVLYHYELFDQLGVESPILVGDSFGAMVAAEVAATDPTRVSKLVLMSAMGLWRDDTPIRNYIVTPQPELAPLILRNPEHPVRKQIFADDADPSQQDAYIRMAWTFACIGKFIWPIPDKGLKKRMHRIKAPTLILWGKQDRLIPPLYAEEFCSRIAGSRVELIDNAAHLLPFEQPATSARTVQNFLK